MLTAYLDYLVKLLGWSWANNNSLGLPLGYVSSPQLHNSDYIYPAHW